MKHMKHMAMIHVSLAMKRIEDEYNMWIKEDQNRNKFYE
jgi:hypothetical protein